ncbi:TIGR03643 family protein [Pseudidiomarina sp.]|uniref:TIGR03643 family protein n=1 Tax=Pseudidiomarina sp. TaxID=2081707 RepID=UPI003A96D8F9
MKRSAFENLTETDISRVIEMAWEDRTAFEAIERLYQLNESQVIRLMRQQLKHNSFKLWRKRVQGRATKHEQLRDPAVSRAYCPTQYKR